MARKRPAKQSAGAKAAKSAAAKSAAAKSGAAKSGAAKRATKKAAKKAAKKPVKARKLSKPSKKVATKKAAIPAAKKARAAKAARKAAAKKATKGGRRTASTARKSAPKKPLPAKRRAAPRISAGRRAGARKVSSREALAKKTLVRQTAAAPKPAKKRPAKRAPATKAAGKTARSRIVARASQKLAPPVLRDAARRAVVKPTAPRPEKPAAAKRRAPFRLHALGVRDEHPTDRPKIEALLEAAFGRPDEADIVERLRADGDMVLALVAEFEGEIVGHIAFSRVEARIDGRAVKALALAPLAVAPARQGRGIGSVLVASGLEAARTAGFDAIFVVGEPGYYERFGFSTPLAARFESPWREALLAIELKPDALAGGAGSLTHPPALRR